MECTLHLECTWSAVGVYFYWWVIWPSPWSGIIVYTYNIRSGVGVYTPVGVVTEWLWSVHSKLECTLRQGKGGYWLCLQPFAQRGHSGWDQNTQGKRACTIGYLNTLRPRQSGRHFPYDTFKHIFLNENVGFQFNQSSLYSIVVSVAICSLWSNYQYNLALGQKMAWRRLGNDPLYEPILA